MVKWIVQGRYVIFPYVTIPNVTIPKFVIIPNIYIIPERDKPETLRNFPVRNNPEIVIIPNIYINPTCNNPKHIHKSHM
jgi:hypothetical protein